MAAAAMILIKAPFANTLQVCHRIRAVYVSCHHAVRAPQKRDLYHQAAKKGIYEPIDWMWEDQIRVLKLQPGRWDDPISCRIKVVSLDQLFKPRYDTLSYTWGKPGSKSSISVNGQTIDVSTNLFMALRALRRRFFTITIWADALCIDQGNNDEKSKQVALMGKIYKHGRRTWVSLGCPDESWADGSWSPPFRLPESAPVCSRLIRGAWRYWWHNLVLRRSLRSRRGVSHIADAVRVMRPTRLPNNSDDLDRLHQHKKTATSMLTWLTTHDYWSRVWIVQEIALSRVDPICLFGRHQIPLLSLGSVLRDCTAPDPQAVPCPAMIEEASYRAQEICMRRYEPLQTPTVGVASTMELLRALQFASYRNASDPRDHIYGLRSLIPAIDQTWIKPNYILTTRELYADVTRLLLERKWSVSLLCCAVGMGHQQNGHNLPSWSLDFRKPMPRLPCSSDILGVQEQENIDNKSTDRLHILRLWGESQGETITRFIAPKDYYEFGHMSNPETSRHVSEFLQSNIFEPDERWRRDTDARTEIQEQFAFFSTDQGRIGKCFNEVRQGDEIWSFDGSVIAFVLRPLTESGEQEEVVRDRYIWDRYRLVGACKFLGEVENTWGLPEQARRMIELV